MNDVSGNRAIKKITMGECDATPSIEALIAWKNEHGEGAPMPLLRVWGMVSAFEPGEGKDGKGPFVRFKGPMIKAMNPTTGRTYESGQCILPGAAPDLLYGALLALGDHGGSVEFAFEIGAHFDESAIAKYVYDVQRVIDSKEADPLAHLEARLKALPQSNVSRIADKSKDTGTGSKKR